MKIVKVSSFFKKVKKVDSPNFGMVRPTLEWRFEAPEAQDISGLNAADVATILEDALEKYGKQLLLTNGDDWGFVPGISEVTVSRLAASIREVTVRSRADTKELVEAAAAWYREVAVSVLGKSPESARAGHTVISGRLSPIAGKVDALEVFSAALSAALEQCSDSDDTALLESTLAVTPTVEWLISRCNTLISEATADLGSLL